MTSRVLCRANYHTCFFCSTPIGVTLEIQSHIFPLYRVGSKVFIFSSHSTDGVVDCMEYIQSILSKINDMSKVYVKRFTSYPRSSFVRCCHACFRPDVSFRRLHQREFTSTKLQKQPAVSSQDINHWVENIDNMLRRFSPPL